MKAIPQRIQLSRKKGFNLQKASLKLNSLPAVNCAIKRAAKSASGRRIYASNNGRKDSD